jgi:type II secretory pathway pseudopilin PulG
MANTELEAGNREQPRGEQGFMLLGLIVVIALILLALSVAASKTAFSLRREREVESARRADQYVRAIRRFYIKNQHYPGSIEQLENTNRVRYLRQRYVDPLTGKANYRLIIVGQNKTTVKGFFGQPLAGIASAGLGTAGGMQSSGVPGATTATGTGGAFGTTSPGTTTSGTGGLAAAAGGTGDTATASGAAGAGGTAGTTDSSGSTNSLGTASGMTSSIGSGLPGTTGPIMGVGSSASGNSILVVNEQKTYETWEFLYDPRIEKLKQAAALNAGASSVGAGSLGTTPGSLGTPGATNGTNSTNPTSTNGSTTPTGTSAPPGP